MKMLHPPYVVVRQTRTLKFRLDRPPDPQIAHHLTQPTQPLRFDPIPLGQTRRFRPAGDNCARVAREKSCLSKAL